MRNSLRSLFSLALIWAGFLLVTTTACDDGGQTPLNTHEKPEPNRCGNGSSFYKGDCVENTLIPPEELRGLGCPNEGEIWVDIPIDSREHTMKTCLPACPNGEEYFAYGDHSNYDMYCAPICPEGYIRVETSEPDDVEKSFGCEEPPPVEPEVQCPPENAMSGRYHCRYHYIYTEFVTGEIIDEYAEEDVNPFYSIDDNNECVVILMDIDWYQGYFKPFPLDAFGDYVICRHIRDWGEGEVPERYTQ